MGVANRYGIPRAPYNPGQMPAPAKPASIYDISPAVQAVNQYQQGQVQAAMQPARRPAPQMPTLAQTASAGAAKYPYQYQTPWGANPAYQNVQLPGTSMGPNQSVNGVRDRIASQYDPSSWRNATSTPTEQNKRFSDRLANIQARMQSHMSQDMNSPLAGRAGTLNNLAARELQQRQQADAMYDARRNEAVARQKMNDYGLVQRANPGVYGPHNQQDVAQEAGQIRGDLAKLTAQYNNYVRGARATGNAMSFREFVSALGANGSPVAQNIKNITGADDASGTASMAQYGNPMAAVQAGRLQSQMDNKPRQTFNPYAANAVARYMGGPVILPTDPNARAQAVENYAMSGNPAAYGLQRQAVDEMGNNYRAGLEAQNQMNHIVAQQQVAQMNNAGANYRAGLQFQPRPMDAQSAMEMGAQLASMHPDNVGREAVKARLDEYKAMGYSPQQMQSPEVMKDLEATRQRAVAVAAPQYQSAVQIASPYLPQGAIQAYGLPQQAGVVSQVKPNMTPGVQATQQGAASAASALQSNQAPDVDYGIKPPPQADGRPTVLDLQPATPDVVFRLLTQNPDMSPEMLEQSLAEQGMGMPDRGGLLGMYHLQPNELNATPQQRKAYKSARDWIDRNSSRYGLPNHKDYAESFSGPYDYPFSMM